MRETYPAAQPEHAELWMFEVNSTSVSAGTAAGSTVRDGILTVPGTLELHYGERLENVQIAWRLTGGGAPLDSAQDRPIIAALGGISAGRYVTGSEPKGWWSDVVGPAGALDSQRYCVLGFDFLGGSGQTTGPRNGQTGFPSISSFDQAKVLRLLLDHLQVSKLHAIVGASYGAMVALAFAQHFPTRVDRVIAISGADRPHPMSTAWRSVQRSIVRYALTKNDGPEGLRLARALAMATYRSSQEFGARFATPAVRVDGQFQFPVESYLLSRGDAYAATYVPEAFVCLSESIDLHEIDATQVRVPVTLVAVLEDQIVPIDDMRSLQRKLGGRARLVELSSLYGHDAFLKEVDALKRVFNDALDSEAP